MLKKYTPFAILEQRELFFMKQINYKNVKITEGFWQEKLKMICDTTLQSVYNRFEETGRFAALDLQWKEGEPDCPHVFWDSDIAKWIEGLAYSLAFKKNEELEKITDASIDKIKNNSDENGYYNSHFLVTESRFTERNAHELYCAGHLMEAAVAYYEATGKRTLLDAMCKYADYIEKIFVKDKSATFVTPGHPEIELALVKLYDVTGEKRYLDLAKFFVDNHGANEIDKELYPGCKKKYNQDEIPVRDRKTADGHCVRALYLFCAMADLAYYYDDSELFAAAEKCFDNIVNERMYITGATGSTCHGEAFTVNYDLPNRDAYAETCASIALALFAQRMFRINPYSKYADTVEKVMYNGILSGISMDGKGFFYENPLEIDVELNNVNVATEGRKRFPITQRKEVFDCSCCPPNVIRFIADIGSYIYSQSDDTLFVHQYIANEASVQGGGIVIETDYPSQGTVNIRVEKSVGKFIALRIPQWCKSFKVNKEFTLKNGYAYIELKAEKEEIELELNMDVRIIASHKKVHENSGRVAVMRGPVVYCLEGVDNGKDLPCIMLDVKGEFSVCEKDFLVPSLKTTGYQPKDTDSLYFDATDDYEEIPLRFIPYFAFANRGESDMLVWVLKK